MLAGAALIVGSDGSSAEGLAAMLRNAGVRVLVEPTLNGAAAVAERDRVDVVFVDVATVAGSDSGIPTIVKKFEGLPVVVAGRGETPAVVEAIRAGAANYVATPPDPDEILHVLRAVLAANATEALRPPAPPRSEDGMLGNSPKMRAVLDAIRRVAPSMATVLVRGESGTGKELAAEAIHAGSTRRDGPFVKMNCAALPDTLLESELFGYERGAFTGATCRKPGRVEAANGGTLFLDEIGDVTPATQVKLLRLLQSGEYERLGGQDTLRADVRFVAATNRDLEQMIQSGQFRQDLFFRLNVVPIWLPPLRSRREDIETLARHFCKLCGNKNGKRVTLTDDAVSVLRSQRWRGNVRELQNLVERLVVYDETGAIGPTDVRAALETRVSFSTESGGQSSVSLLPLGQRSDGDGSLSLDEAIRRAERQAIERALERAKNNRTAAARLLGVSRAWLYAKLQEHGFSAPARSAESR